LALITPALFSRPPPHLTGEEGEVSLKRVLEPSLSRQGGGEAGRRGSGPFGIE